jgi:hypothetical protein
MTTYVCLYISVPIITWNIFHLSQDVCYLDQYFFACWFRSGAGNSQQNEVLNDKERQCGRQAVLLTHKGNHSKSKNDSWVAAVSSQEEQRETI